MSPTFDAADAAWDARLEGDLLARLGPLRARPVPDFRRPPDRRHGSGRLALAARSRPLAVTGILLSAAVAGPALVAVHGTLLPGIPPRSSATTGSLQAPRAIGENWQATRVVQIVPKGGLVGAGVNSIGRGAAAHHSDVPSRLAKAAAPAGQSGPPAHPAPRPNSRPGTTSRPAATSRALALSSNSKENR